MSIEKYKKLTSFIHVIHEELFKFSNSNFDVLSKLFQVQNTVTSNQFSLMTKMRKESGYSK